MTLSLASWKVFSSISRVCILPQYSVLDRVMKEALWDILVNFGCFRNTSSQTLDAFEKCVHDKCSEGV